MARGLFGSRMRATRDKQMPMVPIEELLAMGGDKASGLSGAGSSGLRTGIGDTAPPPPNQATRSGIPMPQGSPSLAGDFDLISGSRADQSQSLAPMPHDVMTGKAMAPMGQFSQTPAPTAKPAASPDSKGLWDEIWSDPFTFFASGTNGLDRKYGRASADEQKQKFNSSLDTLNLSSPDRIRAEMDPEGFFKGMNESNTAQMKPQTDTFFDPVTKKWMRKPVGPTAVAQGTDLVDPEHPEKPIYSNAAEVKPQNLPDGMWYGADGKGPPQEIPGYRTMYRGLHPGDASGGGVSGNFRTLSPQEVEAAGYPKGTVVQQDARGAQIVRSRPSTAQTGQPTESERAAGLHASIALNGLNRLMEKEAGGYNRAGVLEQGGGVGAMVGWGGEDERLYDQSASEFIDGYLRAMTGAAATKNEIDTYKAQWFPQWGDTPAVIKQKAQGRLNALRSMKTKAGRSWNPEWDSAITALETQGNAAAKDPKVEQAREWLQNWSSLNPQIATPALRASLEKAIAEADANTAPKQPQWEPPPAAPTQSPEIDLSQLTPEQLDQLEQQLSQGGQ